MTWESSFPALRRTSKPPCGAWPLCTRQGMLLHQTAYFMTLTHIEFFVGIESMYPSFSPWQTAAYSNIGYQLLSYALESMTGKRFVDVLNDRVIKPLGLTHTYYENPLPSVGIIPTGVIEDYWWVNLGDASPYVNFDTFRRFRLKVAVVEICTRQQTTSRNLDTPSFHLSSSNHLSLDAGLIQSPSLPTL